MNAFQAQVTITRPANATAYTALDVVGATAAAITFPNMGNRVGDHGLITSVDLRIHVAALPSGMTDFKLHLYTKTPPSALADNAAFDLQAGDRDYYLGFITLSTVADLGATLYVKADGLNMHYVLSGSETSLYGYLQTVGGFTPAGNSEVYVATLRAVGL